jgi:hypothetical protein
MFIWTFFSQWPQDHIPEPFQMNHSACVRACAQDRTNRNWRDSREQLYIQNIRITATLRQATPARCRQIKHPITQGTTENTCHNYKSILNCVIGNDDTTKRFLQSRVTALASNKVRMCGPVLQRSRCLTSARFPFCRFLNKNAITNRNTTET